MNSLNYSNNYSNNVTGPLYEYEYASPNSYKIKK